jgi:hypothetical protein
LTPTTLTWLLAAAFDLAALAVLTGYHLLAIPFYRSPPILFTPKLELTTLSRYIWSVFVSQIRHFHSPWNATLANP